MDGLFGGKLHVPGSEYDDFLDLVARAMARSEAVYLIERRTTPTCAWHADLDILTVGGL